MLIGVCRILKPNQVRQQEIARRPGILEKMKESWETEAGLARLSFKLTGRIFTNETSNYDGRKGRKPGRGKEGLGQGDKRDVWKVEDWNDHAAWCGNRLPTKDELGETSQKI